jgi:hypothetical protein
MNPAIQSGRLRAGQNDFLSEGSRYARRAFSRADLISALSFIIGEREPI